MKNTVRLLFLIVCILMVSSGIVHGQENSEDLSELLAEYVGEGEPGVVVYVAYEDEVWEGAYGLANLDTEAALTEDDLFRIASVTKPLVATIVLQLAEEGDIDLDAPISDYLSVDIVGNIANADEASVRQMLQMTSGIFSYTESDAFDDATFDDPSHLWTAEEVIQFVDGEAPYFEAGTDYYYSNTNYILAHLIIENITGNSLADELSERIFAPAGMESCYLETPDRFAADIVRGYQLDDSGEFEDITEINDGVGLGDGGVICSAEDLAKFLPTLVEGEYLSEDMLGQMIDTVEDGEGGNYGLGIGFDEDEDYGIIINHDGATSGFQSVMTYLPDEDLTLVILTNNFDSEIMEDLTYDILDYMFEED